MKCRLRYSVYEHVKELFYSSFLELSVTLDEEKPTESLLQSIIPHFMKLPPHPPFNWMLCNEVGRLRAWLLSDKLADSRRCGPASTSCWSTCPSSTRSSSPWAPGTTAQSRSSTMSHRSERTSWNLLWGRSFFYVEYHGISLTNSSKNHNPLLIRKKRNIVKLIPMIFATFIYSAMSEKMWLLL